MKIKISVECHWDLATALQLCPERKREFKTIDSKLLCFHMFCEEVLLGRKLEEILTKSVRKKI